MTLQRTVFFSPFLCASETRANVAQAREWWM